MATKSILKNVTVRKNRAAARLADILESSSAHGKQVNRIISKKVEIINDPEVIKRMFDK